MMVYPGGFSLSDKNMDSAVVRCRLVRAKSQCFLPQRAVKLRGFDSPTGYHLQKRPASSGRFLRPGVTVWCARREALHGPAPASSGIGVDSSAIRVRGSQPSLRC